MLNMAILYNLNYIFISYNLFDKIIVFFQNFFLKIQYYELLYSKICKSATVFHNILYETKKRKKYSMLQAKALP